MKTTLVLPDPLYKKLKRLAVDRSTTLTKLVVEAISRNFSFSEPPPQKSTKLFGILKTKTSEAEINEIKSAWMSKIP